MKTSFLKTTKTYNLIVSSIFIALGIVTPLIFHFFSLGTSFLPMHIPVLLAGFFLPPKYAFCVGMLTPIASSTLTGMPPAVPVVLFMAPELASYALVTSVVSRKLKEFKYVNSFIAVISAQLFGRIISGIAIFVLMQFNLFNATSAISVVFASAINSLPGLLIQILCVPLIAIRLEQSTQKQNKIG